MSSQILQDIETSIQGAQQGINLGASLERLVLNRDFKQVILTGYLEKEAIRLVHLKADPSMQSTEQQRSILTQLDSIGHLQQYLLGIRDNVGMALKALEATEIVRDELLTEG
jgi:hypothetical protein